MIICALFFHFPLLLFLDYSPVGLRCACENCWVSQVPGRDESLSLCGFLVLTLPPDFQLLCQLWTLFSDTLGFLLPKLIIVKVCTQLRNTSNSTDLLCIAPFFSMFSASYIVVMLLESSPNHAQYTYS